MEPNPGMQLGSVDIVRTVVVDSPNKLFIGGLPCDWTEEQACGEGGSDGGGGEVQ